MWGMGGTQLWDQLVEETSIYFVKNTWQELSIKEAEKVTSLAKQIRADPSTFVTVVGHASGEGTENRNQLLSENRALKVKSLLLAKGVDGRRILKTRGAGSSEKAVPEAGSNPSAIEEQRKKNRRVHVGFHNDPSQVISLLRREDPWEAVRKLPIPGWPPPGGPPPIIKNWDKLPQQQKINEYERLKKAVQEACEDAHIDPGPALDMLKDKLFPGPENEGPTDIDQHRGRKSE